MSSPFNICQQNMFNSTNSEKKQTHCPNLDLIQFDVPFVGQNIDATVHIGP